MEGVCRRWWCVCGVSLPGVVLMFTSGRRLVLITCVVILLGTTDVVHGATPTNSNGSCGQTPRPTPAELRLLRCLMSNYDPAVRPVLHPKDVVEVNIRMLLIKIVDLDEHSHTLDMTGWIHKSWTDHQLTWDPAEYDGVNVIRIPIEKIWTPDLVLYNNAADSYEYIVDKLAELHSDGTVIWIPHARLKAYCNLQLKLFPFDSQTCMLSFGSWTYDITKVNFSIPVHPERKHVFDGNEWKITSYTINRHMWSYATDSAENESYPVISIYVKLKRQGAFYISLLVTPAILIAILVAFIFLIPPASSQRLPFAVGILICQTVMLLLLENFVPTEISDLPVIGVHLVLQMVMVTLSIILSIAVLNCHHRDVRRSKVPNWLRQILLGKLSRALCLKPDLYTSLPTDLSVVNGGASELRTADELGLDMAPSSLRPATIDTTLEDIRRYLKVLNTRANEPVVPTSVFPSHHELVVQEWRQVGLVVDRVLFVLYIMFTVIVSVAIFTH